PFAMALNPVSSGLDMRASTTGSDPFTFNAILGGWFRPVPYLQFGVAGQIIPASIETRSTLTITPLDPPMSGLVDVSRDNKPANDVSIILPLPLMARAGARYRGLAGTREIFDVELDVEYETWSRVNDFGLETNHLVVQYMGSQPIDLGRIGIQKHWR